MHHHHSTTEESGRPDRLRMASRLVFFGFVAVATYFLITEHRAHLFGILPFLLLAACPLLHVFHHRGHGGEGGGNKDADVGTGGHRH
jgi:hypothetical protein